MKRAKYVVVSVWENEDEQNIEVDFFESIKDIEETFDSYLDIPIGFACLDIDTQQQIEIELF